MPTGKDFTREQWNEIYAVRTRLEAYRDKIQPYPAYPEPEIRKPQPQKVEHIVRHSNMGKAEYDLLQQTARKVDWLEKKLEQQPKAKPKQKGYTNIK